jgi:hypothetical protein
MPGEAAQASRCSPGRAASGPPLRLLIDHDDAEREFDYATGAEDALARARADAWTVISIRRDCSAIVAA